MQHVSLHCLGCGSDLKNIQPNKPFACTYCGRTQILLAEGLELVQSNEVENQVKTTEPQKPETPESTLLWAVSGLYIWSFVILFGIWLFYNLFAEISVNTHQYFPAITNAYTILVFGIIVAESADKHTGISDTTTLAIFIWLLYNVVYIILGIATWDLVDMVLYRILGVIISAVIGAIVGGFFNPDLQTSDESSDS